MTKNAMFVVTLVVAVGATAAPPLTFDAQPRYTPATVSLRLPVVNVAAATLVIAGPANFRVERTFTTGEPIQVDLGQVVNAEGVPVRLADGIYKWELRAVRQVSASAASAGTQPLDPAEPPASTSESYLATGAFRVEFGSVAGGVEDRRHSDQPGEPGTVTARIDPAVVSPADLGVHAMATNLGGNHFSGSVTVDSNFCAGSTLCTDGFDNGWDVHVRDTAYTDIGIEDYGTDDATRTFFSLVSSDAVQTFRIIDTENTLYPFTIEEDTPSNTLYIDNGGLLGVGTSAPAQKLHLLDSQPRIRIEATGQSNWEMLSTANGTGGLWFRDVQQGGFVYPIKFAGGSPMNSLVVSSTGKIGVGTDSPYYDFDAPSAYMRVGGGVYVGANAGLYTLDFLGNTGADRNVFRAGISGYSNGFTVQYRNSPQSMVYAFISGNVGIGTATPAYPLHMGSGAYVSAGGVWTNASSRSYKQNIEALDGDEAATALASLDPVKFEYKADPSEKHVGFIAEDVPELLATGDRTGLSPMDVVAVLTKVVQEQQKIIGSQQQSLEELRARLEHLENR